MRAIVYGGNNAPLKNITRKAPKPGRWGRVLVQVHAVGLNPVDAKDVMGDKLPHSWVWTRNWVVRSFLKNKIVGFDFAGIVAEDHPSEYPGFQKGDRVFGNMPPFQGTLVEYISVPLDQICNMPNNCSFIEGAALPLVGLTALQALTPYVESDGSSSVLIIGASGGTGHAAVQVAKNLGAQHVTAICSGTNSNFVTDFCGATHVVDYQQDHGNPDTLYHNLQQSPGWPFHIVLDCVTSADPADRTLFDYPSLIRRYHLEKEEELVPTGQQQQKKPLLIQDHIYLRLGGKSPDWIRAGIERICFGLLSCWPDHHEKLFWIRFPKSSHELKQLQQWTNETKLKIQITKTVPFTAEAVQSAFDQILERRVQGKIVVEIIPSSSEDKCKE